MTTKIVLALDPYGMPRAHAIGPAEEIVEIRKVAREHCAAYVAARNRRGEALSVSDFYFVERDVPEEEAPR